MKRVAAFVLALVPVATSATAKTIRIGMELSVTPHDERLTVSLKVTNSGDEAATSVAPSVDLRGHEVRAPVRPSLGPGVRLETSLDLPWDPNAPGQWPLAIRIDHADANGYPFQAHHVALVATPGATPALVPVIDVEAEPLSSSGGVRARLKSLSDAAQRVHVRFIAPRGLEAAPVLRTLTLEPWADAEVQAEILNRGALPGSRYPVYVAAEYDDAAGHHAAVAHGIVEVRTEARQRWWYLWAAAALIGAWIAALAWRRWGYLARRAS